MVGPNSKSSIRSLGVLLHPTALPSSSVCGTFGAPARNWLHLLALNKIGVWQFLPLSPPDSTGSPYSSPSSFALNPWFLDVQDLVDEGFLPKSVISKLPVSNKDNDSVLDFLTADSRSQKLGECLRNEWQFQSLKRQKEFEAWTRSQPWLEDHVFFMELRRQNDGRPWWEWSDAFALHKTKALKSWSRKHQENLLEHRLLQWHLDRQWKSVKNLAKELGIVLFGDMPFYVSRDSSDVWSNRSLFSILPNGNMDIQSGVPPDYFSSTGQLWGTPVYRWHRHRLSRFSWWRSRCERQWQQVDLLRLDHFRALVEYWAVPGDRNTAEAGEWRASPGADLLQLLRRDFDGKLPLVAEDLGIITEEVESLRDEFALPGMKILQFAFDGQLSNPYLPENIHGNNWVVYTGTHDNPTTIGWWEKLDEEARERVKSRVNGSAESPAWKLIEIGLATDARLMVSPLQDLLCLGDEARFNTPGTICANWSWRLNSFHPELDRALKSYGVMGAVWGRTFESAMGLLDKPLFTK